MQREYFLKPFYRNFFIVFASMAIFIVVLKLPDRNLVGVPHINWLANTIVLTLYAFAFLGKGLFDKLIISDTGIEYRSFSIGTLHSWEKVKTDMLIAKFTFAIKRGIPLYLFADNPIDSDFGQQIKQHAPHLFEKEKSV
jgi:hypothetical protein